MQPDSPPNEALERLEMLYLTAGQIARSLRQPVPVVMRLAVGSAHSSHLPVDDVLRNWAAVTVD